MKRSGNTLIYDEFEQRLADLPPVVEFSHAFTVLDGLFRRAEGYKHLVDVVPDSTDSIAAVARAACVRVMTTELEVLLLAEAD